MQFKISCRAWQTRGQISANKQCTWKSFGFESTQIRKQCCWEMRYTCHSCWTCSVDRRSLRIQWQVSLFFFNISIANFKVFRRKTKIKFLHNHQTIYIHNISTNSTENFQFPKPNFTKIKSVFQCFACDDERSIRQLRCTEDDRCKWTNSAQGADA